jgi:hypothetical protein
VARAWFGLLHGNAGTCRLESDPGGQSGREGAPQEVVSLKGLSTGGEAQGRTVL